MLSYRKEIDGLRAFAVMPVLLFHAGFTAFGGGYVGVDVFFVISGFLIGSIILKELKEGTFTLTHFYERRARRILPALFFVMAVCLPFAVWFMWPDELKRFFASIVATSLFSSNFLFFLESGYFAATAELKPLLHTWSLAVEEQFYIFFPLFMMALWRFGLKFILVLSVAVILLSLGLSQWASETHQQANFFLPFTRVWELLIGFICAIYLQNKGVVKRNIITEIVSFSGLLAILISVFFFDRGTPFPSVYALMPVLGTAAILLFAHQGTVTAKILSFKPFIGIGLISYSAYLWHQPIFAFTRLKALDEPSMLVYGMLILLSLGLAYLSWRFIESPFRDKNRFNQKQIFKFSLLGMAFFILVGLIGYKTSFFEKPATEIQKQFYALKDDKKSFNKASGEACKDQSACALGLNDKDVSVVLIGDSHAGHLIYNLDKALISKNLSGRAMTSADIYIDEFPKFYPNNVKFNKALEKRKSVIFSDKVDTVILSGRYTLRILRSEFDNGEGGVERLKTASDYHGYTKEQQEIVKKQVKKGIENILDAGKKVIIVYPIPEVGWDVPDKYLKLSKSMPQEQFESNLQPLVTTDYARYKERNAQAIALFDSITHPNLKRVYPDKIFCNTVIKGRCITASENSLYYKDDDHLSSDGAALIVREINKFLK